jgi:hypothetical protein
VHHESDEAVHQVGAWTSLVQYHRTSAGTVPSSGIQEAIDQALHIIGIRPYILSNRFAVALCIIAILFSGNLIERGRKVSTIEKPLPA